jgi:hypothetical protein
MTMTNKEKLQVVTALLRWFDSQGITDSRTVAHICAMTASSFAGCKESVEELIEVMWAMQETKP